MIWDHYYYYYNITTVVISRCYRKLELYLSEKKVEMTTDGTALHLQLRQAIEQLFQPSASPAAIQAANRYLYEINDSKDCFIASLNLILSEQDFRIAHFAVNILYNKVSTVLSHRTMYPCGSGD